MHYLQLLREYVPLKQGLRRLPLTLTEHEHRLREYVPLKQGLRLPPALTQHEHRLSESMFH